MTRRDTMSELKELLEGLITKFDEKIQVDEKLQQDLDGIERSVLIEVTDGSNYRFTLKDKGVSSFEEGDLENPDLRVIADTATYTGLIKGDIRPMKAWATKKLQLKASLDDLIRFRKFF